MEEMVADIGSTIPEKPHVRDMDRIVGRLNQNSN
jgi:septum formation inhibitor-activating ATPase MinD